MRQPRRSIPAASSTPASRCAGPRNDRRRRTGRARATASTGPTNRSRKATRPARPTRPCTVRRRICCQKSKKTRHTTRPSPTHWTRSHSSTTSRCRRSWHASWRTSRPADTAPIWSQHFTGTKRKWFTFTNGAHIDSLDPYTFDRLYDFLELFVAHKPPIENRRNRGCRGSDHLSGGVRAPHRRRVTLPPDPIQEMTTYTAKRWRPSKQAPEIRVLFDNGAGPRRPAQRRAGDPYPRVRTDLLVLPDTRHDGRYVVSRAERDTDRTAAGGPGGRLLHLKRERHAADRLLGSNTGPGGLWGDASQWEWNWVQPTAGSAVSYVTAPLSSNTTVIGGGAVNLWVESSTPDVDLQATVSEVRPDGNETFVQNGWIRASERKLATTSTTCSTQAPTPLQPIPTFLASDVQAMPADEFVPVDDPAVLRGTRLSRGLAHQGHDLRAQRDAARVVVRPDAARRHHRQRVDRVRAGNARQPDPPGRARRERAHGTAALSEPAQRALPPLPGVYQRRLLTAVRAAEREGLDVKPGLSTAC